MSLKNPTTAFNQSLIDPVEICPEKLFRISRHISGEPFFSKSGANRFDDYRKIKQFGACYFGLTLDVAFAETVLHDEMPIDGSFYIAVEELETRFVVSFQGEPLSLLDLTGHTAKRLGIDPALSTIIPYEIPQRWSVAIHRHRGLFDGFMYMSRHMNSEKAVVLFDRAYTKISASSYIPLPDYPGALETAMKFNLRFI